MRPETIEERFGPDIEVTYRGFNPTHQQRWLIDAYLTKISQNCPGRSLVCATLNLHGSLYSVEIIVQSFQDSFSSRASDTDLQDCMILLEEKLFSQLRSWKERRFGRGRERFSPYFGQI